jgi:four helix bundle protein
MNYKRFEDLPVWNTAIDLAVEIYALTDRFQFRKNRSLRDQIERAAVSVSNNIAEGFERGTNNELLSFLYIARGSAGEVRSMLCLIDRLPCFRELRSETRPLKARAESCSKQLKGWAQSLQNSQFKGERHVNARTKRAEQAAREREEFLRELAEIRERGRRQQRNPKLPNIVHQQVLVGIALADEIGFAAFAHHHRRGQRTPVVRKHLRQRVGAGIQECQHFARINVARQQAIIGQTAMPLNIKIDIA